ncbi:hypothetical protein KAU09_03445 [Candidatus Parcubacteria bacterium]|nr:hypothetical protein [Candidatus Parcubacteria bacterium]
MSGAITPDSYVIDKRDWLIIDINISEQKRQIVRCLKKGVKWIKVPKLNQKKTKIIQYRNYQTGKNLFKN